MNIINFSFIILAISCVERTVNQVAGNRSVLPQEKEIFCPPAARNENVLWHPQCASVWNNTHDFARYTFRYIYIFHGILTFPTEWKIAFASGETNEHTVCGFLLASQRTVATLISSEKMSACENERSHLISSFHTHVHTNLVDDFCFAFA